MAKIASIIAKPNYLHVAFSGAYEHLRRMDELAKDIMQASEDHARTSVLLDFSAMDGLEEITTIEEHDMAEFIRKVVTRGYRLAILFPELSIDPGFMIGKHLENVAVNRGVALRVFWHRDDAIAWISAVNTNSTADTSDEKTP